METERDVKTVPRVLLASVFGPFGVDDEYGRKENLLELFHNQVTREQGPFSIRMNCETHGLHLIARNINAWTTVLDFPSQKRFVKEIKKNYDYVGISFIIPNFKKARRMAELVREHSPGSAIVLGGHGTSVENIEQLIPCDHVCRGEGVRFFRELLGEDTSAKIEHPMVYAYFNRYVMGVPMRPTEGMIMPGVGCANACNFCATSHFFQKKYIALLPMGRDVYEVCAEMEKTLGVSEFLLMDENFMKSEERCRELLRLMEENGKAYSFDIFSSADAVTRLGVDFMERLGVRFLWMGVECRKEAFSKNRDIDFNSLVKDLRGHGIVVLTSAILFMDHHTKQSMQEDIDFVVGLKPDCVQFMPLGPVPGTALHKEYEQKGILLEEIPYEERHGQKQIWFKHPHFTPEESEHYLREAFRQDFRVNGPIMLRMADTFIRGVMSMEKKRNSPFMERRFQKKVAHASEVRPLLDTLVSCAPNPDARQLAKKVKAKYDDFFGKESLKLKLLSLVARGMFLKETIRNKLVPNNMRQPGTITTAYGPGSVSVKPGK